jgi:CTD small phosphatase-like protein 2
VFTASQSFYANEVLNILDPSNEWITFRLFKDHCYKTPAGHYIKDLRIFKNRDLQNIVIVDNAAYSYSLQIENGVPIIPFFKSKDDNELDKLADYLTSIARVPDVREKITQDFKVDMFKNYSFDLEILKYKLLNQRC